MTVLIHSVFLALLIESVLLIICWSMLSPWWTQPAGRSVMTLLISIATLIGIATVRIFFGDFIYREWVFLFGYLFLVFALGSVGVTIVRMNLDKVRSWRHHDRV